jgi:hypothetical protein
MSARHWGSKQIGLALAALFVGSLACTGSVPGGRGAGGDGGNDETGGTGGSSGRGGTGNMGTGGSPPTTFEPGRVTVRRLNRAEYDNTMRDLLGLDLKPAQMFEFPEDEWGDGFNNDADVLTVSPIGIEKFLTSAQFLIGKALDPAPGNAAVRGKIMVCSPPMTAEAECGRRIVGDFAKRAFRRPVANDELTPFTGLIELAKSKGDTFETGIKLALSAILVSPDFLFRAEIDPTPGAKRALNDWELASRLSYFIWASMPDDALFKKAEEGTLKTQAEIAKQVARMLADPKAAGFTTAMVEQWMHTVDLGFAQPDNKFYPTWQQPLRAAMEQEVRAFIGPVLTGQAPAQDLLTGKYTYANQALAKFYGLPGADSLPTDRFQKVNLNDDRRGGVLRQGSFLVLTSHPDTHSPTRRGKWILERLLCVKPPPPPAMIPAFEPAMIKEGTLREKLESVHVSMGATCNGCHSIIDPMGFGLEHYDGVGLWRDVDNGKDVDATGVMPETGVKFDGAAEMSAAIAKDPRFPACMAKHVLTYALGRKMASTDQAAIDDLGKKFGSGGFKVPQLVELVAQSPLMTHRQAE